MSSSYISSSLRRRVAQRAEWLCEYCLIHEEDTFLGCQVDHIISEKHGGATSEGNLAYACTFCNRHKGSDIGSIVWRSGMFSRFFNPRQDHWHVHFVLEDFLLRGLTDIGEVTVQILGFNDEERLLERQELVAIGRYPHSAALERMKA